MANNRYIFFSHDFALADIIWQYVLALQVSTYGLLSFVHLQNSRLRQRAYIEQTPVWLIPKIVQLLYNTLCISVYAPAETVNEYKIMAIRTTFHRDITNLWSLYPASQQTRDIIPMLVQCWFTVYDAGPTLNQQWDNVSCLLGLMSRPCLFVSHMKEVNVL